MEFLQSIESPQEESGGISITFPLRGKIRGIRCELNREVRNGIQGVIFKSNFSGGSRAPLWRIREGKLLPSRFNRAFIHRIPQGFDRNIKQRFQPSPFYDVQSMERDRVLWLLYYS